MFHFASLCILISTGEIHFFEVGEKKFDSSFPKVLVECSDIDIASASHPHYIAT